MAVRSGRACTKQRGRRPVARLDSLAGGCECAARLPRSQSGLDQSESDRPLCAETSRADAEPLAATASRVDRWILIEYRGLWAHDAVDDSTLSAEVKAHLRARAPPRAAHADPLRAPHRAPGARRPLRLRRGDDGGRARPAAARARRLRRSPRPRPRDGGRAASAIPLFLVCTHGKHDRCCAKYGRPLYDAVREQVDEELGLAVDARRRRPVRRQSRLPCPTASTTAASSRPRSGRCSRAPWRARSTCRATAGARATRSRSRRPSGPSGKRPGCSASATFGSRAALAPRPAGAFVCTRQRVDYVVDVRREDGEPTHLTCSAVQLRRPKRFVAESPRGPAA